MIKTAESSSLEASDVPNLWHYAMLKRCRQCGAQAQVPCRAPFMNKEADLSGWGLHDSRRLHRRRVAVGRRHRRWDLRVGSPDVFEVLSRRGVA